MWRRSSRKLYKWVDDGLLKLDEILKKRSTWLNLHRDKLKSAVGRIKSSFLQRKLIQN